jgi:UDP-N-acetylmuramate dehydrogenase
VSYPAGDNYKLAAGWLIEQCGWKGKRLGNVGVFDKQALVLYNIGGCTGKEVVNLAMAIEADVESKFGVKIECEAIIIK